MLTGADSAPMIHLNTNETSDKNEITLRNHQQDRRSSLLSGKHPHGRGEDATGRGDAMSDTFEQGWAARPFKEQFPELEKRTAEHLDSLNTAITRLSVIGLLTDSQTRDIRRKKFPKIVSKEVMTARNKVAKRAEVKP